MADFVLNNQQETRDLCKCGFSKLAGDRNLDGGFVLWFIVADRERKEQQTESMYLHGTCDKCGDTTGEVLRRYSEAFLADEGEAA